MNGRELLRPVRDMSTIIGLLASEALARLMPSTPPELRVYQHYEIGHVEAPVATEAELEAQA